MHRNASRAHAILNGFGRTLGDGIIGLQALSVARRRGAVAKPVLFRLSGLPAPIGALYEAAGDLAAIADLPWAAAAPGLVPAAARGCAQVTELRDFAHDPAFRHEAMVDYFLARLGVDPATVPPAERRNGWLAARVVPLPRADAGYVLVCPGAAMKLRCMPDAVHERILAWLAREGLRALSQARLAREATLEGLAGLVAGATAVISTDTAMVHLADAYARPCLAFFATHDPWRRVRDYPLCRAVRLPSRLPEAIEFSRGPTDLAAAAEAWFAADPHLEWIDRELAHFFESAGTGRAGGRRRK